MTEAAEVTIRCQRKVGGWLKEIEKNKGHAQKMQAHDGPASSPPTLAEMDIERHQSTRWQKVASVPEKGEEDGS